jgi:DNA-binding winged helix-turn-helix (wHTH) protein/Tol biopolymer transport system component
MAVATSFVFRFAEIEVREHELRVTRSGEPVAVEPKAFRVLLYLLHHAGHLVTKNELLDAVWGETAVTENSLTRAIALLRRVLEDDPHQPHFIETVSTAGYRFICPVETEDSIESRGAAARTVPRGQGLPTQSPESATAASAPAATRTATRVHWAIASVSAALLLAIAGVVWQATRPLPPPRIVAYTQITHDGHLKEFLATDGTRLYFTEWSPNLIGQVGINGGEIAHLPISLPGRSMELEDISPDGSNALASTDEEGHVIEAQWLVPILGGAVKRLEDGEDGAVFSPDGGSVVYSTSGGDIFMARLDGSGKHKLANVGSPAYWFRWSPDGKVIRFRKQDGFWEMSADGTGVHRLLPNWKEGVLGWGKWTQDGDFFIFKSNDQIWALDERRGLFRRPLAAPIQLTSGPIHWQYPTPAKDGSRLIFAAGSTMRGELTRIDPKTGVPQPFLDGISAEYVSFSPDGNFVAYVAFPEGTLWRANRDGSNRMQLTQPPSYVFNPRWSPDSKELLFASQTPDYHVSAHRISASDGTSRWLPSEDGVDMSDPSWSPEGAKVVFQRGFIDAPEKLDLRIVDLKTRQVTVVPGSAGKWSPRWSPNGRYIAALIYPQVNHLPVFDLKLQRWFDNSVNGDVEFPAFSHDSRYIYFTRMGPDESVFRIPVTGGKEERVVDMTGWHQTGHFAAFLSLDPADAPLILRDASSDDLYALTLERK